MLQFILGMPGSGKTAAVFEEIKKIAANGENIILIVPDQYSFETEREVYRRIGARHSSAVEVVGFKRLAQNIFRTTGGLAGEYITEAGRYLAMAMALKQLADNLEILGGKRAAFTHVENLVTTVRELKTSGITAENLKDFTDVLQDSFAQKTGELGLIMQCYDALLEKSYRDEDNDLARASKKAAESGYFENKHIFIDSYAAFMAEELEMIKVAAAQAKTFRVALSCAEVYSGSMYDALAVPTATKTALEQLAHAQFAEVLAPLKLGESKRAKSPQLALLGQFFMRDTTEQPDVPQNNGDVKLFAAGDVYEELYAVAVGIKKLVTEENYRYSDIAVIARQLDGYKTPMKRIFESYAIPYFTDAAHTAMDFPFISIIRAALRAVLQNFESEAVMAFAKNLCVGISLYEVSALENYVYMWSVKGGGWLSDFTNHVDGMEREWDEYSTAKLAEINATRKAVVEPLTGLKAKLKGANGVQFATALYEFLEETGARQNLLASLLEFDELEKRLKLEEAEQIWNELIKIFDIFAQTVGENTLPLRELCELFEVAVKTIEVGKIPETLDKVLVGTADRIRPNSPAAVFVIGACEGEFPAVYSAGGILTPAERKLLKEGGLQLFSDETTVISLERYYAYAAVTAPAKKLFVSWPQQSLKGENKEPSAIVQELQSLLGIAVQEVSGWAQTDFVYTAKTALEAAARQYSAENSIYPSVMAAIERLDEPLAKNFAEDIALVKSTGDFKITKQEYTRALYGENMRLSPSAIERFYRCPFSYFCYRGLRLRERGKVEFNPLSFGNITHMVLEKTLSAHTKDELKAIPHSKLRSEVKEIIDNFLQENLTDKSALPKRFTYLYTRLVTSLVNLIKQIADELSQSLFTPTDFELELSHTPKAEPLELLTPSGAAITVTGTVDRVDVMESEGGKYLRVVDYKSGVKTFSLSEVVEGLNMQMLIYLFSIWQNGKGQFEGITPAGVLYMPARAKFLLVARTQNAETAAQDKTRQFKMSGLVLDEDEVIKGMEENGAGVYVPVKLKKDGRPDTYSSVVSLEQFGAIKTQIEKNITQMAELLYSGKAAATPLSGSGGDPCTYCEYKIICRRDAFEKTRKIESANVKQALEKLEEKL